MLPYFKIPKITRAQERRKEQELRAIIKTLARNKLKSDGKVFAPFNTIIVKSEPPEDLLTAKDWFSDLIECTPPWIYMDINHYVQKDPYFKGMEEWEGYDLAIFHAFGKSSTNHGWLKAWPKLRISEWNKEWEKTTDNRLSNFTKKSERKFCTFFRAKLADERHVWISDLGNKHHYVVNQLDNNTLLFPKFNNYADVFWIDALDFQIIKTNKKKIELFVQDSIVFIADKFSVENGIWEKVSTSGDDINALLTNGTDKDFFFNKVGDHFQSAFSSAAWSDSHFEISTLSKIFACNGSIPLRGKLKTSTIAMLYKLQKNGYVQLANRDL